MKMDTTRRKVLLKAIKIAEDRQSVSGQHHRFTEEEQAQLESIKQDLSKYVRPE